MAELSLRDETPGGTTVNEGRTREDGRGQGGEENPPTAQATRAQGDDCGKDGLMGGPRTAELPRQ